MLIAEEKCLGPYSLLAGSFSMAAGEYVSMASQREMYEREISLEAQELAEKPEEEREELVLLYRAKGLPRSDAAKLADRIMADQQVALDLGRRPLSGVPTRAGGRAAGGWAGWPGWDAGVGLTTLRAPRRRRRPRRRRPARS